MSICTTSTSKTGRYEQAIESIGRADDINSSFGQSPPKTDPSQLRHVDAFRRSGIYGYMESRYPREIAGDTLRPSISMRGSMRSLERATRRLIT